MTSDTGHILWHHSAEPAPLLSALTSEAEADLVVIGGGFTGVAAALEAASRGASVIVLEAKQIGHGGSGRNVGLVNAGLWLPPAEILKHLGQTPGEQLIEALAKGPERVFDLIKRHRIACEATRAGTLHLAHAPSGLRDLQNRLEQGLSFGAPLRLLDRAETEDRTGSAGFHGALLDPRAGTIQPLSYLRGLARAALTAGARLFENSPATALSHRSGSWRVETAQGAVRAQRLLLATNGYHSDITGLSAPQVVPMHYCQFATAPLTKAIAQSILPAGEGCWDTGLVMRSFRMDQAGRLIFGGIGAVQGPTAAVHRSWAPRALAALFPQLAGHGLTHIWQGRIAVTGDHLPKALEVGPNALALFGYSGRGIAPGTVLGQGAAAALLSGNRDNFPLKSSQTHKEPFAGLRGLYYATGATLVRAAQLIALPSGGGAQARPQAAAQPRTPQSEPKDDPMTQYLHPDAIRGLFSAAMSEMYRTEVPQYGTLIDLVRDVNQETLATQPALKAQLEDAGDLDRLDVERHGAIRLGTPAELSAIRRMFAVMGMFPVGYYDLSVAGIPVHSTAFRPIAAASLRKNPFRVFTSLLRLDLLQDRDLAEQAAEILSKRQIVTDGALALIETFETEGGLSETQAKRFVTEALETFRWHSEAVVDGATYKRLHDAHRLVADVVSFKGPHINHLTPRTLDIDAVQAAMPARGISPKAIVEGPPRRDAAILLRQTSFKALEEKVRFLSGTGPEANGTHTARFGEIEQRGIALTPKGRAFYDDALARTRAAAKVGAAGEGASDYVTALTQEFADLPDVFEVMRDQELGFFNYRALSQTPLAEKATSVSALIEAGHLAADPQTYEDFLPVSAAGIFQSNLGSDAQSTYSASANQDAFEAALGASVADEMALYSETQRDSLRQALTRLGQTHLLENTPEVA